MAQKRGHMMMPTVSQLSRFMSVTPTPAAPRNTLQFAAAMSIYAEPYEPASKIIRFADMIRIVKEVDFENQDVVDELISMRIEEEFDEAAVPDW